MTEKEIAIQLALGTLPVSESIKLGMCTYTKTLKKDNATGPSTITLMCTLSTGEKLVSLYLEGNQSSLDAAIASIILFAEQEHL